MDDQQREDFGNFGSSLFGFVKTLGVLAIAGLLMFEAQKFSKDAGFGAHESLIKTWRTGKRAFKGMKKDTIDE